MEREPTIDALENVDAADWADEYDVPLVFVSLFHLGSAEHSPAVRFALLVAGAVTALREID